MATYLIGYDLNKEGANYSKKRTALIDLIKAEANGYCYCLESTWIIKSEKAPEILCGIFTGALDENDEIIVIKVSAPASWSGLSDEKTKWLREYLD